MERETLGLFTRASHPTVTGGARRGRGHVVEHEPGTTLYDVSEASNLACSLNACDLASHDELEQCVCRSDEMTAPPGQAITG